jgi:hypothetical protein
MADPIALEIFTTEVTEKAIKLINNFHSLCSSASSVVSVLYKREVELLLEDHWIAVDIQRTQIVFDLVQHVTL